MAIWGNPYSKNNEPDVKIVSGAKSKIQKLGDTSIEMDYSVNPYVEARGVPKNQLCM